jgi:hypothetical protein
MTAVINNSVAENFVCWCEGRNKRKARAFRLAGVPSVGHFGINAPIL